jgi:hypothetical protein
MMSAVGDRRVSSAGLVPRVARVAAVLAFYVAASGVLFGRHVLADPSHTCACLGGAGDPPTYMWALAWWPYALTHAVNPFFTHVAWSPVGVNVAAAPMIPLPSMAAWPLTAAFGLLPAYDALAILSPAVAATTMYLLCRWITHRRWASLAGGWAFGFSSYELSQRVGHANLMLIALLPLAVLAVLARLDRRLGRAAFLAAMTLLIAGQLLTSSEILATSVAFGALAFLLAWVVSPPARRAAIARTGLEVLSAGALAAVITSPYLYYSVVRVRPAPVPGASTTLVVDLAGLVVPSAVTLLRYAGSVAARLPGNVAEQGAYIGLPLLGAFCAALWERRRTPAALILGATAAVALLLAFGSRLSIAGHRTIPLPWALAAALPIAKAAVPDRIVLYVWFALAVALAMWLASPARWSLARWAVVILGFALILPDGGGPLFNSRPSLPALFTGQAYKRVLPRGSVVLILPYAYRGYSMLWQAQTQFAFRMPEGNLSGVAPRQFQTDPVASKLLGFPPAPVSAAELGGFLTRFHVSRVIVDPTTPEAWPTELAALGLRGRTVDGAIVYTVGDTAAAVGSVRPSAGRAGPGVRGTMAGTHTASTTHTAGTTGTTTTTGTANDHTAGRGPWDSRTGSRI